jgi:hypothetical protein
MSAGHVKGGVYEKGSCSSCCSWLAAAFTAPAFAADVATAKTKADCDKAGGVWDATTNKCKPKM